jgi:hypothetical protein
MGIRLEVVVLPVADVGRAESFYESLGRWFDAGSAAGDDFRVVRGTAHGSSCPVILGAEISSAAPGAMQGLRFVISDNEAARAEWAGRGAEIGEIFHEAGNSLPSGGAERPVAGPHLQHRSYAWFASCGGPDGNGSVLQEITDNGSRADKPERIAGSPAAERAAGCDVSAHGVCWLVAAAALTYRPDDPGAVMRPLLPERAPAAPSTGGLSTRDRHRLRPGGHCRGHNILELNDSTASCARSL